MRLYNRNCRPRTRRFTGRMRCYIECKCNCYGRRRRNISLFTKMSFIVYTTWILNNLFWMGFLL